jgi:hypothetical protein
MHPQWLESLFLEAYMSINSLGSNWKKQGYKQLRTEETIAGRACDKMGIWIMKGFRR